MTTSIIADIFNYPCTICMGFCLENENCVQCDLCLNWFHKECVNLSNEKFKLLVDNIAIKFTCTICIHNRKCEVCDKTQNESRVRFLYCVTCLKHFCDDCNPFLSDQIHTYRSTDEPFYCSSCSAFNPCKICIKHCYQDAVHQPSIVCSGCNSRVHTKCSKLTRSQLNKFSSSNENSYLCNICRSNNLPFLELSKTALQNLIFAENNTKGSSSKGTKPLHQCTLCVQCNSDCEECITCPDSYRVCPDCLTDCKYVGIHELNIAFAKMKLNDLSLVYVNIRSLSKNLSKFENMLRRLDREPDIICITETKLNESIKSNLDQSNNKTNVIKLPGYEFYHTISTTNAGGAGLYVSGMCSYKVRDDLNICIDGECEAKFVEIITSCRNSKNVIVGSMYRHPHDNNHQEFLSEFSRKIECIQKKYYIIIMGDINVNTKDNNNQITKDYKNTLLSLGLRNTINLPTRITETTDTILDHIITNVNSDSVVSQVITQDVSDHLPISGIVNMGIKRSNSSPTRYIKKFTPSKKDLFVSTLNQRIHEDNIFSLPESCPYNKLNSLISHIQQASDHVFPTVKLSNKQRRKRRKPWMTTGILKSMDRRDLLFKEWLRTKNPNTRRAYNKCRNKVNRIVTAAKQLVDTNLLKNSQSDKKKFWKNLNKITKRKQNSNSTLPVELKLNDGETVHNATVIANQLNKHFVEKGPSLASKLPRTNRNILQTLGPRNPHKMKFTRIQTCEVADVAVAFEEKLSTGSDNIPAILLKWCIHIISPILAEIFNCFVDQGIYPEALKTAKVTPLHKKGDKDVADNFRSISVLTQINKVFEKLIHMRLMTFIQKHNILTNTQFGCRKGHNTSHSVSHLNQQVIKHLEKQASTWKSLCNIIYRPESCLRYY